MARTKASVGAKVFSGKSRKAGCSVAPSSSSAGSSGSEKSSKNYSGGNPVCPRETPKWQKPITNFFINNAKTDEDEPQEALEYTGLGQIKSSLFNTSGTRGFVRAKARDEPERSQAGSSKQKAKKNVIHSDDEEDIEIDKPKNKELDETIELEPLKGEECHKIEDYYFKDDKKKGKGKKSNKENIDVRRNSVKRDLDSVTNGEESEHVSKKVKVG